MWVRVPPSVLRGTVGRFVAGELQTRRGGFFAEPRSGIDRENPGERQASDHRRGRGRQGGGGGRGAGRRSTLVAVGGLDRGRPRARSRGRGARGAVGRCGGPRARARGAPACRRRADRVARPPPGLTRPRSHATQGSAPGWSDPEARSRARGRSCRRRRSLAKDPSHARRGRRRRRPRASPHSFARWRIKLAPRPKRSLRRTCGRVGGGGKSRSWPSNGLSRQSTRRDRERPRRRCATTSLRQRVAPLGQPSTMTSSVARSSAGSVRPRRARSVVTSKSGPSCAPGSPTQGSTSARWRRTLATGSTTHRPLRVRSFSISKSSS